MHLECRIVSATARAGSATCSAFDNDDGDGGESRSREEEGGVCKTGGIRRAAKGKKPGSKGGSWRLGLGQKIYRKEFDTVLLRASNKQRTRVA